jgi:aquaporin Z
VRYAGWAAISGGAFKPAVVLGGFAMGTVSASILRPYLVVQAVAGIAAGLVFRIFNPGDK